MPYEGEYAKHRSIARIANDPGIKYLLDGCRHRDPGKEGAAGLQQSATAPSDRCPNYIIAVDGGNQEIPIKNGYPGAEASFITVSSVLMDVALLKELDRDRPVDPVAFRKIESSSSINAVLPGCNVIYRGNPDSVCSFRQVLFELLGRWTAGVDKESETLLQTFEALMSHRPDEGGKCPFADCPEPTRPFRRSNGVYLCQCPNKRELYSSDALRIHEGVADGGSSGKAFGEVRQVLEHLWLIHLLRLLAERRMYALLSEMAFVVDGPLAIYGHPAWLSTAIYRELRTLNQVLSKEGLNPILVLGIEKSGNFVNHLDALDIGPAGQRDQLPRQVAFLLTDQYIKDNVVLSDSSLLYGHNTYYGRKLFYKTRSGARIVANIAYSRDEDRDTRTANDDQYCRLPEALALLDRLESSRYPNAIIPLSVAHAEAALPLNTGTKVLEELAKRIVGAAR